MGFTNLTVAGLKLWLKADTGVTLSGSDVTAWADQSGNGNNVGVPGGGTAPLFNSSSINSLPGITFGGSNAVSLNNTTSNPIAAGAARSIFIVARPQVTASVAGAVFTLFRSAVGPSTPGVFCCEMRPSSGTNYYYTDGYVNAYQGVTPSLINTPSLMEWLADAEGPTGALTFNINATTYSTPTNYFNVMDGGATGFTVGNREDNGGPTLNQEFIGDICEVLVYDSLLGSGDLQQVHAYIQAKYAISLGVTALSISPSAPTVAASSSQTFTGADGSGTGYTYSIAVNNSGGSINSSTGVYTAGATGSVTDTVRVTDSVGDTADATVTVTGAGPPPTGLKLWLKADAGITLSGSNVTAWADQSGGGNNATSFGVDPTFDASVVNGLPGVKFNGSSSYMLGSMPWSASDAGFSIFYVAKTGSSIGSDAALLSSGTGHPSSTAGIQWGIALCTDAASGQAGWAGPSQNIPLGTVGGSNPVINTVYYGGYRYNKTQWAVEGVNTSTPADTSYPTGTTFSYQLGVQNTGVPGSFFNGDICEILVYDHAVAGSDLTAVRAYINAKYFSPLSVTPALAEVIGGNTQTFVGSGGVPPYAYSISTNNSGSTIDPSTGVYDTTGAMTDEVDVVTVTDAASSTVNATVGCVSDVPSISPGTVTLNPGDTNSFLGNGGIDTSYTWAITVNNSGGSINSSNGDYTAGSTGGVTDTVQLTDAIGFTATATVTITGPVQISPTSISVEQNGSTTFTAVGGTTPYSYAITVNNSGGSIDSITGVYTAGSTGGVDDTVEVTDASTGTSDATVHVTVMTISPTSANVPPLGSQTFTGTGGTAPYSYAITVNNSGGSINSSTGVYTAGSTPNCVDTIEVTDALTSTADAVANVGDGVTLSPGSITLVPGGTHTFTASGGSGTGFVYSFDTNGSGGTINSSTGFYTAGNVAADDLIIATDSLGNVSTDSTVTIPGVTSSPASATVPPRGTADFSASGGSGTGYTWAFVNNNSGGTINASTGHYVAGATGSVTDVVQVTDSLGNTSSGTAITVTANLSISPTSITKAPSAHQTFSHTGGSGTSIVFAFVHNNSGGTINSSTGAYIAGTTGSVTDTVSVTDGLGNTAQATVTVTASLTISPTSRQSNIIESHTFTDAGGSGSGIHFSVVQNQSGCSINTITGVYTSGSTGATTDIVRVTDDLGNTADATITVLAPPPPTFFIKGVAQLGLSTLRVTFTHPARAISPANSDDALNPDNYTLLGNDLDYVIAVVEVVGDPTSFDCLLATPLDLGKWRFTASNIKDSNGIETI